MTFEIPTKPIYRQIGDDYEDFDGYDTEEYEVDYKIVMEELYRLFARDYKTTVESARTIILDFDLEDILIDEYYRDELTNFATSIYYEEKENRSYYG